MVALRKLAIGAAVAYLPFLSLASPKIKGQFKVFRYNTTDCSGDPVSPTGDKVKTPGCTNFDLDDHEWYSWNWGFVPYRHGNQGLQDGRCWLWALSDVGCPTDEMADNIPFTPEIWNGEAFPGSQACRDIAPVGLGMSGLSVRVKCTMNGFGS